MRFFGRRQKAPEREEVKREEHQREVNVDKIRAVVQSSLNPSSTMVEVKGDAALEVTAYKRALDVLAGSAARLPLHFMRLTDGRFQPYETSPLHYLLTVEPQVGMSAYRWKFQLVWRAFHDGDAYIWPRVVDGEIAELVLISRRCCAYDSVNGLYTIHDMDNGVNGVFGEGEVIHILFNTIDGQHGIPLWALGKRALSISATGDNETLERFAKGGNVRGIVSNDFSQGAGVGQYGKQQLDSIAEDLEYRFKVEGRNIAGVPGDAKLTQFSMSSTDMQFLDSRKFAVLELSRLTGVPPIYLYDGATSNYKMPEQADMAFLTQTLDGILLTIEGELQRKLIGRMMGTKRKFEFDRERVHSMDLGTMATYIGKTLENGTHTINDWRRRLNQPDVEDGDIVYVSTNRARLGSDKLGAGRPSNDDEDED